MPLKVMDSQPVDCQVLNRVKPPEKQVSATPMLFSGPLISTVGLKKNPTF